MIEDGRKKMDMSLVDLSPVFGKMRWMPIACYLFGNIIIVDPLNKTFYLCLSEDRKENNI